MNPLAKDPWTEIPIPTWVTADTHFGHAGIQTICPWRATWSQDLVDHNDQLIQAWNAVVGPADWVLHLGDFAMGERSKTGAFRARLQGRIILVRGNHDATRTKMLSYGLDMVVARGVFTAGNQRIACIHNVGALTHQEAAAADVVLHGHSHGTLHQEGMPSHLVGKAVDCGPDAVRTLAPIRLAEAIGRASSSPVEICR